MAVTYEVLGEGPLEKGCDLTGKVCIVTGAGSRSDGIGTGRASAIVFALRGARVLAVDVNEAAADRTVQMICAHGGEADSFVADVTDARACAAMVSHAVARWGRVDVLKNNVGIEGPGSVADADWSQWDAVMRVNATSVAMASSAAIEELSRRRGVIINVASIAAFRPHGITPYSTSKGAVIALTRAMAVDHGPAGVRVNCIAPGPIYTPMVASNGMSEDLREKRRTASALGVEGYAWDVAHAAAFLASEDARYITGVVLPVDGGVSIMSPSR